MRGSAGGIRRFDGRTRNGRSKNPFVGTKELSGLIIVMNLINNWDIQSAKQSRSRSRASDRRLERWFIVSDLGATFGRMGGRIGRRSKWKLDDYIKEDFIEGVEDNQLKLDYEGFSKGDLGRIPIDHAPAGSPPLPRSSRRSSCAGHSRPRARPRRKSSCSTGRAKISELQAAVK